MAREHGLGSGGLFGDWRELFARPQLADAAVVATSDTLHVAPALAALARGYHVLLEKPIAPQAVDCERVVAAAEKAGRILQIGHVLRYTAFYRGVHEIVASAAWAGLADRARGARRRLALDALLRARQVEDHENAAPIILAKCCHDLDLLVWPRRPVRAGRLLRLASRATPRSALRRERPGAARPLPGPGELRPRRGGLLPGPGRPHRSRLALERPVARPLREARRRALETGPYGRCVYRCDNDALDHQLVAVEFEGGLTASFSLHGHAVHESRVLRVAGEQGELRGVLERGEARALPQGLAGGEREQISGSAVGHFGGDDGLVAHFADVVRRSAVQEVLASGREALEGHLLGFAAERAREQGRVIELAGYRREIAAAANA